MSNVKYCPLCDRKVVPKRKVPWVAIVLSLVLVGWFYGLGVLIAIGLYLMAGEECPICKSEVMDHKPRAEEIKQKEEYNKELDIK